MALKIGLEIHGYLVTKEKLFCRCKNAHKDREVKPNTYVCPVCTGQPGAKPMLPNVEAVRKILQISLLLGCKINKKLVWQRKHYSWPDLPKGFQTTISGPHATPVGVGGKFSGIRITECHLEEDPAAWNPEKGTVDYNRSGAPLIEIVTEPDFKSAKEVKLWLNKLLLSLSYIKALDKNAGFKSDVNVSVYGDRVEIKNVNSIEEIFNAIEYEAKRQEKDKPLNKETRRWDSVKQETTKMREKEGAADYRFISEPDLPVVNISDKEIKDLEKNLPETPMEKLDKMIKKFKIDKGNAEILTRNLDLVEFFEKVGEKVDARFALDWVTIELLRVLNYNKKSLDEVDINVEHFVELLKLVKDKTLTELKAKQILNKFVPKSFSPKSEVKKSGRIDDPVELGKIVDKVIKNNSKAVEDYNAGEKNSFNFLMGQIMKESDRRADFGVARGVLEKRLKN